MLKNFGCRFVKECSGTRSFLTPVMEYRLTIRITVIVCRKSDRLEKHWLVNPLEGEGCMDQPCRHIDYSSFLNKVYFLFLSH
jgi:hypothetical protein